MPLGAFRLNGLVKRLVAAVSRTLYGGRTWGTDSFQIHNVSKYGSRSLWFPGIQSSNFVELGGVTDDLKFHIETKTWEVWVYPTAWTANASSGESSSNIMGNSGYDGWGYNNFGFNNAGKLIFGYAINNTFSTFQTVQESGTSGVLNQWQHIALVQNGGTIKLYHNGVERASATVASTPTYDFGNQRGFNIGVNSSSFRGYLDDLRISKTARYGGTFTPPATAHTNDANTVVLYHWDNAALINPAGGFPSGWDDGGAYAPGTTPTSVTAVSLIDAVYSSVTSITVPAFARVDDFAILFDSSTNTTSVVPSGWTAISNTTTSGIRSIISYKKLVSSDLTGPAATVSGLNGSGSIARKTLVIVRPNAPVSSVSLSTPAAQATTAVPTNQTLSMSGQTMPLMGFAHYAATGAIATRTGAGNERELVNTTRQYVKNWTHNITAPANQTIGMSDGGTNTLQSFWIRFIP
jgi:hypothetical protein